MPLQHPQCVHLMQIAHKKHCWHCHAQYAVSPQSEGLDMCGSQKILTRTRDRSTNQEAPCAPCPSWQCARCRRLPTHTLPVPALEAASHEMSDCVPSTPAMCANPMCHSALLVMSNSVCCLDWLSAPAPVTTGFCCPALYHALQVCAGRRHMRPHAAACVSWCRRAPLWGSACA